MSDHEAIRSLSYAYTFALDAGDFAEVARILQHATLRFGDDGRSVSGPEAIERFYASQVITYDGDPRTRHLITNHVVDVTGDTATGRCYFTVLQKRPGEPYGVILGGQYRDAFARVDGAWRFAEKHIRPEYLNDTTGHFRISSD